MADLGTDASGVTDLTDEGAEVSGRMCLVQALARRIITPRASLIDDENYGFDITDYLDGEITPTQLRPMAGTIDSEFQKDERCLASSTLVTFIGGKLRVVSAVVDAQGPFKLTLDVSQVTVDILSVQT